MSTYRNWYTFCASYVRLTQTAPMHLPTWVSTRPYIANTCLGRTVGTIGNWHVFPLLECKQPYVVIPTYMRQQMCTPFSNLV